MRTGDSVYHRPSGETWLVAFVRDDELVPCGWPFTYAKASDCELRRAATDEEHHALLVRMSEMNNQNDARCRYARWKLAEPPEVRPPPSAQAGEGDGE